MGLSRRVCTVRGTSSDAGLVRLLTASRVLKANPIEQPGEGVGPPWVTTAFGVSMTLVTVALGLNALLHSLASFSRDEAGVATFLAALVILSWVAAIGLVCALAFLTVLCLSRDRRATPHEPEPSVKTGAGRAGRN